MQNVLRGWSGESADRAVMIGFAPASVLHEVSYADVLDEESGRGYQRRLNAQHSLDFRRYVQQPGAATIPLTFNLRPDGMQYLQRSGDGAVRLRFPQGERHLAQVDCQHRLGYLSDVAVALPFMCFLGLSQAEEMEVFGVINGKARGLSSSLLDFHDAQLCEDLARDRPELLIALHLKNEAGSPWHNRLDLGGDATSGLERRASLRTMQKAAKGLMRRLRVPLSSEDAARAAYDFWVAMDAVAPQVFMNHRAHLVTKGIGVYALMEVAGVLINEAPSGRRLDRSYFIGALADFAPDFDWTGSGPLKGLGGEGGVPSAVSLILEARRRGRLRVAHG